MTPHEFQDNYSKIRVQPHSTVTPIEPIQNQTQKEITKNTHQAQAICNYRKRTGRKILIHNLTAPGNIPLRQE